MALATQDCQCEMAADAKEAYCHSQLPSMRSGSSVNQPAINNAASTTRRAARLWRAISCRRAASTISGTAATVTPERIWIGLSWPGLITRTPNEHLAFGIGEHFCLGAGFARLELKVMFEELFRRFPDIDMDGPAERLRSTFIGGIKHLPVRYTPAG